MIDEQNFTNSVAEFRVGKSSMNLSEEISPAPVEEANPDLGKREIQVAGIGKATSNLFKKLTSRSSDDIMRTHNEKKTKTPEMSLDEAESLVQAHNYSKNSGRPINEENLGSIFNGVESSEDLNRLVDIAGTAEEKVTKQTFKDIEADSDVFKDLAPILKGTQKGLFTAKQQYGMRRLMLTAGERSADLARKIAAGDSTPELLLEYKQTFASFESLYQMAKGNARETARALNQQKMLAQTLSNKNIREMKAALEIHGANPEGDAIVTSAKNMVARLDKGASVSESMTYVLDHKLNLYTRGAVELWKNNILSGLGTHATNLSSVAVANLWENFIIRPTAMGIGKVRSAITGNQDRIYSSEFVYQQAGAFVGFRSSWGMFVDAFKTGQSKFGSAGKMEDTGAIRQIARDVTSGSQIGETFADASTLSFRLLLAEDDAMRGIVFTSELYALAARDGRMKGLTGKKLLEHADSVIDNPPPEMYDAAIQEAARKTFTQGDLKGAVGMMAKYTRAMTGQVPALQFILPFVNTPANLLQYGMDTSIIAAVSPRLWKEVAEGGAKGDMALAKISTGTSLSVAIWQMYEAGMISGSGPEDYALRQQMEKEGWKPNAVKSPGGKWYQIKRMEPFSTSMALVAEAFDKAKYAPTEEEARHHMAYAMLTLAETAFDSSWMSNTQSFMDSLGDAKKWKTFQSSFAASFIPYSAALRTMEQISEPVQAKVSDDPRANRSMIDVTADRMKSNLPGMSDQLRPARYWDGTVIEPDQGGFAFSVSPIKTGDEHGGDIANRELVRNGVSAREPSSVVRVGYTSFSLLDLTGGSDYLYDAYIVSVGKARREVLNKVVNNNKYGKLNEGPNSERFSILQRALGKADKLGFVNFLKDDLLASLDKDPELNSRAEAMFLADPKSFIKDLIKEMGQFDLRAKQVFTPTRGPVELPTEQTYIPRF